MNISRRSFLGTGGMATAFTAVPPGQPSGGRQGSEQSVQLAPAELPLLRSADVIVAGGSLAGVSLALTLAKAGRKVILVEARTYLGREITACLRPWLPAGTRLPALLRACTGDRLAESGSEIALRMDRVKVALEDSLLEAGIELLYATCPVSFCAEGIVVANKSGRQVLRSCLVVDATETALLARLCGTAFESAPARARFRRTIEYDEAGEIQAGEIGVPGDIGLAGNRVVVHRGYRGPGHVQVEFALDLPVVEYTHETWMAREIEARKRSFGLAAYLAKNHPAFHRALLAHTSYELDGPATAAMKGDTPGWAARLEQSDAGIQLSSFAAPLQGLWCIEAARLTRAEKARFAGPIGGVLLGEAIARSLLAFWGEAGCPGVFRIDPAGSPDLRAGLDVRELESPQAGRRYEMVKVGSLAVPIVRETDVLVVGGGTSGATAGAVAAREGMRTVVLEMNPGLGGTGTIAAVDSYWFGRQVGFAARVTERVAQVQRAIGYEPPKGPLPKWNIEAKMFALLDEADRAGAEIFFRTIVAGAVVERGNHVRGVVAATPYGPCAVLAKVVIDASGDGDVAAFAGAEFVSQSAMDHVGMWYNLARFIRPGRNANDFTSSVDIANVEDYTRAIMAGRRRGRECHDHGIYPAPRETRHVLGDAVLTLTDLLRHRCWPDVIGIHYGNSDMKGKTTSPWILSGLIPPNLNGEICYRMVLPVGFEDIMIAGKAFSATHDGVAGVRFQADLENLGGSLALAAAKAIREKRTPRDIDIRELQQRLVKEGVLPEAVLTRKLKPRRYTNAQLRELVKAMLASPPLLSYQEEYAKKALTRPIPFVEVCTAGPRVVPILMKALHSSPEHRTLIAQALALCGSKAGVPALVGAIDRLFQGGQLPPRTRNIRHANIPPDQGAMPDAAYLLYSLGMTCDRRAIPVWRRVAELLRPSEEQFDSRTDSPFHYIDAVCYGAERLAAPEAIPVLEMMHTHKLLNKQTTRSGFQVDPLLERRAMLELAIAKALARCGSPKGYELLIDYLDDNRAALAEQAHRNLVRITRIDFGKDAGQWKQWLQESAGHLAPCPLTEDLDAVYERDILVTA